MFTNIWNTKQLQKKLGMHWISLFNDKIVLMESLLPPYVFFSNHHLPTFHPFASTSKPLLETILPSTSSLKKILLQLKNNINRRINERSPAYSCKMKLVKQRKKKKRLRIVLTYILLISYGDATILFSGVEVFHTYDILWSH